MTRTAAPQSEDPTREPSEITLLTPDADASAPVVSVVIPALNEELTIEETVAWCLEGFRRAGVEGEVLIVDSSDDATPALARRAGARVLRVPRRGLGRAYIDATDFIRGRWVVLGDADCTYDFRAIEGFLDKLADGYEFVMGSRFKGSIEPGAMPLHHRYFGTPATNAAFNLVFGTRFSDIHCGMRALTLDAYRRIDLVSQGWEYASEMIIKAVHLGLRSTEVPIDFYRDRNGRISNVKRGGWTMSWKAGWHSLRVMFVFGADFFLVKPGAVLTAVGLSGGLLLSTGPLAVGQVTLTLHTHALMLATTAIGLFALSTGLVARAVYDRTGRTLRRIVTRLPYNRVVAVSTALAAVGVGLASVFAARYVGNDFRVDAALRAWSHLAMTGLLLVVVSFVAFTSCLVLHALAKLGAVPAPGTA